MVQGNVGMEKVPVSSGGETGARGMMTAVSDTQDMLDSLQPLLPREHQGPEVPFMLETRR